MPCRHAPGARCWFRLCGHHSEHNMFVALRYAVQLSGNLHCLAPISACECPAQFGRKPLFIGGSIVMASMMAIIAATLGMLFICRKTLTHPGCGQFCCESQLLGMAQRGP